MYFQSTMLLLIIVLAKGYLHVAATLTSELHCGTVQHNHRAAMASSVYKGVSKYGHVRKIFNLCMYMCSRVMCLVASVCVHILTKRLQYLVSYHLKYLAKYYIQQAVQMEQLRVYRP